MKKYKLIKEYPGSPELGSIAWLEDMCYKVKYKNRTYLVIEDLDFKNYPEFWELFVEKDYEILSFISKEWCIAQLSYFTCKNNFTGNDVWKIYSVKRLSDGEIFTIGDRLDEKCFRKLSSNPLSEGIHVNIITKIAIVKEHAREVAGHLEIQNGKLMFSASNKWGNLNVLLSEAIKFKQPLFTTEDGVDIFEGDKYFICTASLSNCINNEGIVSKFFKPNPNYKYFSTKEKAEEYILMNKPVLSLKEIKETTTIKGLSLKKLEKLVQQKLKS